MMDVRTLYTELNETLEGVDKMIDSVTRQHDPYVKGQPAEERISIYDMRYRDGKPVLAELMATRAQLLVAMSDLSIHMVKMGLIV